MSRKKLRAHTIAAGHSSRAWGLWPSIFYALKVVERMGTPHAKVSRAIGQVSPVICGFGLAVARYAKWFAEFLYSRFDTSQTLRGHSAATRDSVSMRDMKFNPRNWSRPSNPRPLQAIGRLSDSGNRPRMFSRAIQCQIRPKARSSCRSI